MVRLNTYFWFTCFNYQGRSKSLRLVWTPTMRRRQEMRRRRERMRVVKRREGGREGVGVFSCSKRIARQQRLSRSCRRACNIIEEESIHIYRHI